MLSFTASHAAHRRPIFPWRALKRTLELLLVALLATMLGTSLLKTTRADVDLLRYRTAVEDVANAFRAMQAHARGHHLTVQFMVDEERNVIRIISMRNPGQGWQTVERTLWLPAGLQILEAPRTITFSPTQPPPQASLVFEAPAYNKSFRILLTTGGIVHVYENSLS